MSRLTQEHENKDIEWDNGLNDIRIDPKNKEKRIILVDADSIIHSSIHPLKSEERLPYTDKEIDTIIIPKIKERLYSLNEEINRGFSIQKMYCFVGGKGSYRRDIYPDYKANRPEKLEIITEVYRKCVEELNFIRAEDFLEADDMLYILGKEYGNMSILCFIDKDLRQIPGIVYDYNKNIWYTITPEEARHSLAVQVCTGDAGDNIKCNKGCGPAKADKYIKLGMSNYQYIKNIIRLYRDFNKEVKDVKPLIRLTYKLVSLGKKYNK